MQVTDIRIRKVEKESGALVGFASVTFDDAIVIHDIGIIHPEDKDPFIAMPSRRLANGKYIDIAHPIRQDVREEISSAVLKAFDEASSEG